MLNKLLKYDLKYIYKSQVFIYGMILICLFIAKTFQTNAHGFFIYRSINFSFLIFTYALIFILMINNFSRLWSRFKNTIYGDESYLIHTLPITKSQIFLSKVISSIITISSSTLFVFIVDLVVRNFKPRGVYVYSDLTYNIFSDTLNQYLNNFQTQTLIWFLIIIVLITLSIIGYFSLILGHKAKKNKLVMSIIIGTLLLGLTLALCFGFYTIIAIFNSEISNFLWNSTLTNKAEKTLIIITIVFYTVSTSVYYLLGLRELKKGIDVE